MVKTAKNPQVDSMNISCVRRELLLAVSKCAAVAAISVRSDKRPVLSHVLIDSADGMTTVRSTDMDMHIIVEIPAMIKSPGLVTAEARVLERILKSCDSPGIEIEFSPYHEASIIRSGSAVFTLPSLKPDDFPAQEHPAVTHIFNMDTDDVRLLIGRAAPYQSTDGNRYYLEGVYLHPADDSGSPVLRAAATDGHRLARIQTALPDGAAGMPAIILPTKLAKQLLNLCSVPGNISIEVSKESFRASSGNVTILSRTIDGSFPEYERVIPKDRYHPVTVGKKSIAGAVRRVSQALSAGERAINIAVKNHMMILSAGEFPIKSAQESIEMIFIDKKIDAAFNARYMSVIIKAIAGHEVRIDGMQADNPSVWSDPLDDSAMYMLMPMVARQPS